MKAVLTYTVMIDDKQVEETRLFDTEKSRKICGMKNGFGYEVQEIYITKNGILFIYDTNYKKIKVADQKQCKEWIGINEPDKYIEFFGEVEEG